MARHRNIRSMNYSDGQSFSYSVLNEVVIFIYLVEYDYDDVYGHSVEDDYCVSPSEAAFMYNREGSKNQQIGAFIKDIAEEDESDNKVTFNFLLKQKFPVYYSHRIRNPGKSNRALRN